MFRYTSMRGFMNKLITLKKYNDPSHGWLAVKKKLLEELNILDLISSCSYEKGKTIYLEEDHDLSIFLRKCEESNISLNIEEKHTNNRSQIRTYNFYKKEIL